MPTYANTSPKKFLDANGLTYISQKLNRYPTNEMLSAVIEGVQDALEEKENLILHDTSDGWVAKPTVVPNLGQIVVYDMDNTHDYARIKIGDGVTIVSQLPFIDAGTVNGQTIVDVIQRYNTKDNFPAIGDLKSLYFDNTNEVLYCWNGANGYVRLSFAADEYRSVNLQSLLTWDAGTQTTVNANAGTMFVVNGTSPTLEIANMSVLIPNT